MSHPASIPPTNRSRRRAFSLVEVLVATMIMGLLLVAAMRTVGSSVRAGMSNADGSIGFCLAQELMSEVLTDKYLEPDDAPVFGPEPSETGGTRSGFDDVDDYHNWDASPPQNRDGTEIPDRAGWRRQVTVEYVEEGDLTVPAVSDQGVKRVTVTVTRGGTVMASLVGIRTDTDESDD